MGEAVKKGKYTAILIDDEKWTRDVLRRIGHWEEMGVEIAAEASDGEYGLELVTALNPDIIISDVKMPNMDGLTLLNILRERNYWGKILFVSGYDDYDYVRNAIQLKANDYLLKPVKPDEFNKQLSRCVSELKQWNQQAQRDLNLEGILRVKWFGDYVNQRTKLYEGLKAMSPELVKERMKQLESLVIEMEGEELPKNISIYIYVDLYNILHKFIYSSGCLYEEIFDKDNNFFVFGSDFAFTGMVSSIEKSFLTAIGGIEGLRRGKNRIDIKTIQRYVDNNYAEEISLEKTAEKFFVSKEYLSKMFKLETGYGFAGYITEIRMNKARELLLTGKTPIKDIVEMVGYKEVGHFYKVFKKHFGVTPGEMKHDV